MSCATDTKVKPCTLWRVGTATERKTVAGCGNAKRLSQEQCPVATGLATRPTMMNHSFSTALQTTSCREWTVYTVIKRRIGARTSTAAEPQDIVQSNVTAWSNYINNWDAYMNYRAPHPWVFTGAYSYHSNKKEWVIAFVQLDQVLLQIFLPQILRSLNLLSFVVGGGIPAAAAVVGVVVFVLFF